MNDDHRLDVVTANIDDDVVHVLLGNGDGTLQSGSTLPVGSHPNWIASGDSDSDGKVDSLTANSGDGTLSVLLGNGGGAFHPAVSYPAGENPTQVELAELNGDSKLDVVCSSSVGNAKGLFVFVGVGDGTLIAKPQVLLEPHVGSICRGRDWETGMRMSWLLNKP